MGEEEIWVSEYQIKYYRDFEGIKIIKFSSEFNIIKDFVQTYPLL